MGESRELQNHDRLGELPDSLIITILSFLEMIDAVRTTVLSRRWRNLWTTVPSLNFACSRVGNLDTYRRFVSDALLRWKGTKILRFDLPFFYDIPRSCELDSWLLFAIGKLVEELRLCFCLGDVDSYYSPPQCLYTCSSMRKLTLSCVKLSIPENVQLSQLTSLTVEYSESLSESSMSRLLTGAPMLEELSLICMAIEEDFNIRSESLKKLQIDSSGLNSVLRIWAPNLSTLEILFGDCGYGSCIQLDVPSLTTAILDFYQLNLQDFWSHQVFGSIRHAQTLTLKDWCIEVLLHLKSKGMSVEFPNTKHLQLFLYDKVVDEKLLALLRMFPNLLTLIATLCCCTEDGDDDSLSVSEKKIDIPLPHLKTCEISFSATNSSVLRGIEAVLENGEMLEKMVLRPRLISDTLEKLLSMRRASPKARVIISKYKHGFLKS